MQGLLIAFPPLRSCNYSVGQRGPSWVSDIINEVSLGMRKPSHQNSASKWKHSWNNLRMLGKVNLTFVTVNVKPENSTASFGGGFDLHIKKILSWCFWVGILALVFLKPNPYPWDSAIWPKLRITLCLYKLSLRIWRGPWRYHKGMQTTRRDKNETMVQTDVINQGQTSGSLVTGGLFPVYLRPV